MDNSSDPGSGKALAEQGLQQRLRRNQELIEQAERAVATAAQAMAALNAFIEARGNGDGKLRQGSGSGLGPEAERKLAQLVGDLLGIAEGAVHLPPHPQASAPRPGRFRQLI
jgi:hypothetical protein